MNRKSLFERTKRKAKKEKRRQQIHEINICLSALHKHEEACHTSPIIARWFRRKGFIIYEYKYDKNWYLVRIEKKDK